MCVCVYVVRRLEHWLASAPDYLPTLAHTPQHHTRYEVYNNSVVYKVTCISTCTYMYLLQLLYL